MVSTGPEDERVIDRGITRMLDRSVSGIFDIAKVPSIVVFLKKVDTAEGIITVPNCLSMGRGINLISDNEKET